MGKPTKQVYEHSAYPPRGMRSDRAAAYLGMSETSFLRLVDDKIFPPGIRIRGMVVWDRYDLDTAFENLKVHRARKRNTMDEALGLTDDEGEAH